jgi:hypothetical protein
MTVSSPLRERRKRASRRFLVRVVLLISLICGVAYVSWYAPWARTARGVRMEIGR